MSCRYDDHDILAGQGTAAKEIKEQVEEMKIPGSWTVVVPVGGGGLVAGMSAFMARSPHFNVIVSGNIWNCSSMFTGHYYMHRRWRQKNVPLSVKRLRQGNQWKWIANQA